nr:DUF3558 family protein [Jiangella mangrovi]
MSGCGGDGGPQDEPAADVSTAPTPPEAPETTEPPEPPETATPEPGFEGDPALAALDPCALVDAAGLASLGLTGGEPETLGQARVCRYRFEGPTLTESFTVSVEFFGTYGLDDIVAESVDAPAPMGAHESRRFIDITGGCGIGIGVSATSRVDATAVGGDQDLACEHATALAALVEPALP